VTARALTAKTIDLVALVKPRILIMALLTAAGAASLAPGALSLAGELWMLAGTALIVGCANTLNMWLERDVDCLMSRTKHRPLPMQRLTPRTAIVFGAIQGALALPTLALAGIVPAALGLVALLLYVGVYTPLKQRTHWATWIGAIPGAMPALIGWTSVTGRVDLGGLSVFGVLFFWQIPHTHAIAIYRQREYDAAGLKTLPGTQGVAATRRAIAAYLAVQVIASLAPTLLGITHVAYTALALALGAVVLAQGLAGVRAGDARWARRVFLVSIIYLPILFAMMVFGGRLA
jgi:protoheme IX farnesyltransferase